MFVVKNAWKSVTRNKGRNMLIIVIVTIIAAAATIGLSIRQAAATARSSGLDNTTVTAQISLDRGKLISESREQSKSDSDSSDASAKPDFDVMRSALADKQFSLADYQKYAKASSAVKSTIIWRHGVGGRPTISSRSPDSSGSDSSSSSGSSNMKDSSDTAGTDNGTRQDEQPGGPDGQMGDVAGSKDGAAWVSGRFLPNRLHPRRGRRQRLQWQLHHGEGKVFGYDASSDGDAIISKSLADRS